MTYLFTTRQRVFYLLYMLMIYSLLPRVDQQLISLKKQLSSEFEKKNLGEVKKVHGMKIERDKDSDNVHLTQKGYL